MVNSLKTSDVPGVCGLVGLMGFMPAVTPSKILTITSFASMLAIFIPWQASIVAATALPPIAAIPTGTVPEIRRWAFLAISSGVLILPICLPSVRDALTRFSGERLIVLHLGISKSEITQVENFVRLTVNYDASMIGRGDLYCRLELRLWSGTYQSSTDKNQEEGDNIHFEATSPTKGGATQSGARSFLVPRSAIGGGEDTASFRLVCSGGLNEGFVSRWEEVPVQFERQE